MYYPLYKGFDLLLVRKLSKDKKLLLTTNLQLVLSLYLDSKSFYTLHQRLNNHFYTHKQDHNTLLNLFFYNFIILSGSSTHLIDKIM